MRVDTGGGGGGGGRGAVPGHKYAVHPRTIKIQAYLERSMERSFTDTYMPSMGVLLQHNTQFTTKCTDVRLTRVPAQADCTTLLATLLFTVFVG